MTQQENWRIEQNAVDYFGHQKKRLAVENRKPVIRKASDLVGPGIGASATRITDFNNLLATFNGYYASDVGAENAPTDDQAYVGITTMDSALGGAQMFFGLSDGETYKRTFTRNPLDSSTIYWGNWRSNAANAYWIGSSSAEAASTTVGWNQPVQITAEVDADDPDSIFEPVEGGIQFNARGLYEVAATASFDTGVDATRIGVGFYTSSGDIVPEATFGGAILGGNINAQGSADTPWFTARTMVRVKEPGAQVLIRYYYQSATSRVFTVYRWGIHKIN